MSNKAIAELTAIKDKREEVVKTDEIVQKVETLMLESHEKYEEEQKLMDKIGLNAYSSYQRKLTEQLNRTKQMEKIYSRKVFRGEDIKKLCQTYYMKMLPAKYFIGDIDAAVPRLVAEFCKERDIVGSEHEFFILAPNEMFNTTKEEVPPRPPRMQDPILFYRQWDKTKRMTNEALEEEEFVQVANWGKDFTFGRKFKHLFSHYRNSNESISMFSSTLISAIFLIAGIIAGLYDVYSITAFFLVVSFAITMRNSVGLKNIDRAWNVPKH